VNAAGTVTLTLDNPTHNFTASNGAFATSFISNGAISVSNLSASGTFAATTGIASNGDVLLKSEGVGSITMISRLRRERARCGWCRPIR